MGVRMVTQSKNKMKRKKQSTSQPGQWPEYVWKKKQKFYGHWSVEVWLSFVRLKIEAQAHFNPCCVTGIFLFLSFAIKTDNRPHEIIECSLLDIISLTGYHFVHATLQLERIKLKRKTHFTDYFHKGLLWICMYISSDFFFKGNIYG